MTLLKLSVLLIGMLAERLYSVRPYSLQLLPVDVVSSNRGKLVNLRFLRVEARVSQLQLSPKDASEGSEKRGLPVLDFGKFKETVLREPSTSFESGLLHE